LINCNPKALEERLTCPRICSGSRRMGLTPWPGRRAYEATKPGFLFFLCLFCVVFLC